jgi:hypothetical protein
MIALLLPFLLLSTALHAQAPLPKGAAEGMPTGSLPAELLLRDWLQEPFQHGVVKNNATATRKLEPISKEDSARYENLTATIKHASNEHKPLGIIFLDENSKIIFEEYHRGATVDSKIIAYSMSKSLTSLAVGKALCEGHISSLDDPAEKYSSSLAGTRYGAASIKALLMMSSGGMQPNFNGQPVEGVTSALLRYKTKTVRGGFVEYGSDNYKAATPGLFNYKNFDTYALGVVVADATKKPFHDYFAEVIWSEIGAQADGAWLLDKNGDAATAEGFGATLRDWARVAIYIVDKMKPSAEPCFRDYLKQATTRRIANKSNNNRDFYGYGYHFWVDNWMSENSIWMRGYGGQMIGINPINGRLMVVLSNEGNRPATYTKIFETFSKN